MVKLSPSVNGETVSYVLGMISVVNKRIGQCENMYIIHWYFHDLKFGRLRLAGSLHGDAIWHQSTSDQVMACCLTAPSHYLNQC